MSYQLNVTIANIAFLELASTLLNLAMSVNCHNHMSGV